VWNLALKGFDDVLLVNENNLRSRTELPYELVPD
jgi:hypothetical protein